ELAFFSNFVEDVPETIITAETDETINPARPVKTKLSETDELVDLCDQRCQRGVRGAGLDGFRCSGPGQGRRSTQSIAGGLIHVADRSRPARPSWNTWGSGSRNWSGAALPSTSASWPGPTSL